MQPGLQIEADANDVSTSRPPKFSEEDDEEEETDGSQDTREKSTNRGLRYQEDVPVFKSHENMIRAKTAYAQGSFGYDQMPKVGYSLEGQKQLFMRLNSIKALGHSEVIVE